jgi:hypothetical protein
MAETTTTTKEVEIDEIATLLAQPGSDSIMLPEEKEKNNLFSRKQVDLTFLDKKPEGNPTGKTAEEIAAAEAAAAASAEEATKKAAAIAEGKAALEEITNLSDDEIKKNAGSPGRPKTDKDALYQMTKKLIEKKMIVPFEDEKPLEEYTLADYEELYEANDNDKQRKLESETPVKFFNSLPDKLKVAAKYVADGGQDLEGLFLHLGQAERVAKLDPETEGGSEAIARQYLQSTNFGTPAEIEDQVNEWKDVDGMLEKKANQFKPKLDALQEQFISYKLQEQEEMRKEQIAQSQHYMKNVYEILEPGELNGVKLDKKTQSLLYVGLTQPKYATPNGKQTNLLGHLLDKYQFIEPRHDLIAEALWLLADPEGYKAKLREGGKKDATLETVRKLKTEEARKLASTVVDEGGEEAKPKGLKRPSGSDFFKR